MKSKLPSSKDPPCCPYCGIPMYLRHGRYGYFWSCPNYPRCPFTLNYSNRKLSSSQKTFLDLIRQRESLCRKYIDDIKNAETPSMVSASIGLFENNLKLHQERLQSFFAQNKYKDTQTSFDIAIGMVYYAGAQRLYDFKQYVQAESLINTALLIVTENNMYREGMNKLKGQILFQLHPSPPVQPPLVINPPISPDPIVPKKNGFIAAHRHSLLALLSLSVLSIMFVFTYGFGLSYTPQKASPKTYKGSVQSVPLLQLSPKTKLAPGGTNTVNPINNSPQITSQYVGNSRTGKFHIQGCRAERRMSESNRIYIESRDEAINRGFVPCLICHP